MKRIDAHLQDVRNQLDAGLVPPNDVLNVEAQESRQRMLAIQARGARDVSAAELGAAGRRAAGRADRAGGHVRRLPNRPRSASDALVEQAQTAATRARGADQAPERSR